MRSIFISRWQLVQRATRSFELRVVTAEALHGRRESVEASICARLPGVETTVVEVDEIPLQDGKFRPIVPLAT